jgi:hypothetical protein
MRRAGPSPKVRTFLALYAALMAAPFAVAVVTWDDFWTSLAPVSALLALLVVVALARRRRWAWFVLVAFDAAILVSYAWDPAGPLSFVMTAAGLALLLAPPVRGHVFDADGRAAAI